MFYSCIGKKTFNNIFFERPGNFKESLLKYVLDMPHAKHACDTGVKSCFWTFLKGTICEERKQQAAKVEWCIRPVQSKIFQNE